jgi:hypothetical protein
MKTTVDRRDDGFQVRVHMTFSEQAHPLFVKALRELPPRARSRLIRTLVERALAVGPEQELHGRAVRPEARSAGLISSVESPLAYLGSAGSMVGAEEMGA